MLREKETAIRRAVILLDIFAVSFSFFLTFFLRRYLHMFYRLDLVPSVRVIAEMSAPVRDYFIVLILIVPAWSLSLYFNGMYKSLRTKSVLEVMGVIVKSAFFTTLVFGTFVFFFKMEYVSRVFFAMLLSISTFVIFLEKSVMVFVMRSMRKRGYNFRKILIVGTGRRAVQFIQKLENHPEWGFRIVGIIDYDQVNVGKIVSGVEVLSSIEEIPRIIQRRAIDEIIFVIPRSQLSRIEDYLYICETHGINVTIAVDLFDVKISKLRQTDIDGIPLITFDATPANEQQLFLKRAIDVAASGFGIMLLSPVFLIIAMLIKATSRGPVLYIQKRSGLNGRKFVVYKFRSMYKGAHERLPELMSKNEMSGPIFKIKNDPRVTPVGRLLRKFSLDELPQLFNVLMGTMSLVGPRPPLPKEVRQYEPWQRRRLSMRPGITCLWQIGGRNKIGFDQWMKLDLEYIDNWSLWLDIKILLKTIPAVLSGRGAC
ncbi:MAG: sugar transferase [Candidatus Omnitrophica bacterium]|nr:sugar transferase [Candidatus Omnitrophota bacterium]